MFFIHLLFCSINPQPLPVEHVLFDFGDVVIQKDHNRVVDFFETTLGLDHTESMILYEERSRQLSAGISDADFFADFEIRHKTKLPKNFFQSFEQVLESSIIKDEKVLRIIEKMKSLGIKVHLFSNTYRYKADAYKKMGLYAPFESVFLSYEVGAKKPHKDFYEYAIRNLHAESNRCLLIDDKISNVLAAKEHHWQAIHFKNANNLEQQLIEMGILKSEC